MIATAPPALVLREGQHLEITIPWPHFPRITPAGKLSNSKVAGKALPWLTANNTRRLKPVVYHAWSAVWKKAGQVALADALGGLTPRPIGHPVVIEIELHRGPTAREMDWSALVEGAKPVVDSICDDPKTGFAGLLPKDSREWVKRIDAAPLVHVARGQEAVVLRLRPA